MKIGQKVYTVVYDQILLKACSKCGHKIYGEHAKIVRGQVTAIETSVYELIRKKKNKAKYFTIKYLGFTRIYKKSSLALRSFFIEKNKAEEIARKFNLKERQK